MDTKDMILELRTKMGLSQDELAEKVFVTRHAVSRWENGETTPEYRNPEAALQSSLMSPQYAARLTETAYLPMLRDAPCRRGHQQGDRRLFQ